jgi:hypothetical protein
MIRTGVGGEMMSNETGDVKTSGEGREEAGEPLFWWRCRVAKTRHLIERLRRVLGSVMRSVHQRRKRDCSSRTGADTVPRG